MIAATTTLAEVVALVERRRPHLCIMDVRGVGRELGGVVRQLQERCPAVKVVIVVESVQHLSVQELMRARGVRDLAAAAAAPAALPRLELAGARR